MLTPELMNDIVKSHHDYLLSLARGDSLLDDIRNVTLWLRNAIGRGMVRSGRWLEGHTPQPAEPSSEPTFQES